MAEISGGNAEIGGRIGGKIKKNISCVDYKNYRRLEVKIFTIRHYETGTIFIKNIAQISIRNKYICIFPT